MKKEIELLEQIKQLTEFAFELYKEARLNAELVNEHITKELYGFRKMFEYDSEFIHLVAERYNNEIKTKEQIYQEKNYIPYLRANFDTELFQRIERK